MKNLAVLCNLVLVVFTALVVATDGAPTAPAYIAFTLLLVLIPILSVVVMLRAGSAGGSTGLQRLAGWCNIVLLVLVAWAIVDQYPHPQEPGFFPFVVLVVACPILSAFVLFRRPTATAGTGGSGVSQPA